MGGPAAPFNPVQYRDLPELPGRWMEDASTKPQPNLLFLSRQEQRNQVTCYSTRRGPLCLHRDTRDRRWLGKHHRAVPCRAGSYSEGIQSFL